MAGALATDTDAEDQREDLSRHLSSVLSREWNVTGPRRADRPGKQPSGRWLDGMPRGKDLHGGRGNSHRAGEPLRTVAVRGSGSENVEEFSEDDHRGTTAFRTSLVTPCATRSCRRGGAGGSVVKRACERCCERVTARCGEEKGTAAQQRLRGSCDDSAQRRGSARRGAGDGAAGD